MANLLIAAAIICVLFGVGASLVIVAFLNNHGAKINWLLLRLYIPRYVGMYRKMTIDESGKPGFWYYCFVVCMVSALVFAFTGLYFKSL